MVLRRTMIDTQTLVLLLGLQTDRVGQDADLDEASRAVKHDDKGEGQTEVASPSVLLERLLAT